MPNIHEVKNGDTLAALWAEWHVFVGYVLVFAYLAIYWNNHHHMLYVTEHVSGGVLWANMCLLFWLSLVPLGPPGWERTTSPPRRPLSTG